MTTQHDPKKEQERQELRELLGGNNYERSWSEAGNDLKQSLKSGGVGAVNAVLGLANLQSKGQAGKNFQERVWDTHKTQQEIQAKKSDTSKMQQGQFERAEGFGAKLGTVLKNPLMAVDATVESLPSMLAGGVMGRAVGGVAGIGSGVARGAIGEGMTMGGSAAENLRSQNKDGLLTGKDYVASVATGVGGVGLGYAGGKLAQRLGIADVDTMVAGGVRNTINEAKQNATKGGIGYGLAGIGKGAIAEGVFEELPQTILETGLENWAKGRDLTENMAGNAALGLVSGGMMGGVAGGMSSNWRKPPTPDTDITNNQTDSTPQPPDNGDNTPLSPDDNPISPTGPNNPNSPNSPDNGNGGAYFDTPHNKNQTVGFHGNPVIDTPATGLQNLIEHTPLDTQAEQTNTTTHQTEPISQVGQIQQATPDVPQTANGQDVASEPTPQNTPFADVNPQTFANLQNFDSWLNQEEFVNQYKAQQELNTQKPSEQMGLDPNQGSLTRSAVVAVDSGATQVINPQAGVVAGATGEQAQEGTLARASMQSEPLSAYQTQLQERTAQQEVQAQEAKAVFANAPKLIGKQNYIQNQNERLPTQIMAVEADSLMPSVDNTTNQARDRSRATSRVQVDNIANNLDPMQLTDSTVMGHGSPTISDDGTIIAGNGRTMAIKQAYLQGKADEYRQMLMERADEYGLDKIALAGMKNPVLVKSVGNVGADKLRQLALNSNETGTMTQSAFENARADVERVANINLNQLHADERGDINTSSNRHIINEFVSQFPIEQQNAMRTSNGVLSKQGLERFENALLLSTYGDNPTTQAILESTDEEVRNAVKAIVATAPTVAKTKQGIQDGITPNDDIASDITEALSMLAKLRQEGVKPSDYLAQTNLFGDELSPTGQKLLAFIDENIRSVVKIRQLLYKYYDNLSQENLKQDDVFGKETQTKQSRLNQALQELGHDQFVQPITATTTATAEQARPTSQASQVNERPEKSVSDEQGIGRDDGQVTQKPKNALDGLKSKREAKAKAKINPNAKLRADWGVDRIDGFAESNEFTSDWSHENSTPLKDAFLKDSENYLKSVQTQLESRGYKLYTDKKGKPEKIRINKGGNGASGEVTLIMHKDHTNVYVQVSANNHLVSRIEREKMHPQAVQILYRVGRGDYNNRFDGGQARFDNADLTAGEFTQKLNDLVQKEIDNRHDAGQTDNLTRQEKQDYFPDEFANAINENVLKSMNSEQLQAISDMLSGKDVDTSVFDNIDKKADKSDNQSSNNTILDNIRQHPKFDSQYQAIKDEQLQKELLSEIVGNVYRDNIKRNDIEAYKQFIANKDEIVGQLHQQLKGQANANQPRNSQTSDRVLADRASKGVATDDTRETASVHSKTGGKSAGRDTNQSENGNDNERSPSVQSDGAQTGVSERVNADFDSYVKNHDTLAKATKAYFDDHLKGKAFDTVIGKVHILGSSWQKKLKFGINSDPLQVYSIPHIPEILTYGNYEGRNELTKDRKDDFVAFHSFVKEINANGVPVFARLLVGEKSNKQFEFVVYSIYPNQELLQKETPNSSGLSEVTKALLGDGNSLAKSDNDVNTQTTAQALQNAIQTANQADFALSDEMVQTGSVKDKLATNIAIIELLQTLKQENRQPTNDEKALMAKYTGFGGLPQAFPDSQGNYKKGFETLGAKLRNLLSKDEYDNARASSTSAFFTPPSVINAMWDVAQRLGYNGGMVLEPSAGVGAFIGHAPKNLPQNIIGTEIDPTTHAITGYLYPHANIFNQGYETLSVPDNSVDLAIGNPPYGGVRLNFKDKPHLSGKTIANSFMQGTLEQVKPNGLSVMVVSSSFMDSTDASTRKAMAELGELVGAVRLPNTTFDEAGTAVVADILVFKKHDESTLQAYKNGSNNNYPSWVQSGKRTSDNGVDVNFNPYFDDKMAGVFEFGTGEGGRAVYTVKETGSVEKALDNFVKSFEKVKPTRSIKEIQAEIDTANKAMIESLILHSNGQSEGYIGRENGVLVQVIERIDGNATSLAKRPLLPSSVWSDSYYQDLDGRWYRLEDVKDKNGKAVKEKDKDGKTLRINKKQKVYYDEKDISAQSKLGVRGMNVISRALEIQGLTENQLRLEQQGAKSDEIESNRAELNRAYDEFVKKFGYLNNANNAKYIDKLPKANFILALETGYKKQVAIGTGKNKEITEPEKAGKADILSKRVLEPKAQKTKADNPQDALSLSLAYRGYVDLDLMQDLTGQTKEQLTNTLSKTGELFFDPQSESWVIKDEYLSGNIRQKLNTAKEHNLAHNVAELEKVLPKDVEIENISIRLGMNWLPEQIYGDFAKQLLGNPNAYVEYEPITHTYSVVGSASHTAINEFGAGGKNPEWILDKILNNKQIRVTTTIDKQTVLLVDETQEANDMAKTIKGEFENFIYSHPDIANIAKLYNEKHNAVVGRKYDGSHLELSGKVPDNVIKLRTHQKNAVWRGITTNAVLYDHAVGSGKTFTGIARAMERKRLGLSKKPVLVVPNHMVGQFAQDIYRLYPSANVLAAGTKDFAKAKRKRLFGQIATGDYDIIVLPHSSFEFMKLSADRQKMMLEQERDKIMDTIRAMKAEQGKRESVKQLEQAKKNLDTKLAKLAQTKRHDSEFSFEQMGIDDITVDEAHEFKNLFFTTKMQGVKGLGSPAGSNKAMDLWLKTQYLHQTNGSVAFMTGTPISNSAAEMHAMMRYLMPDTLNDMGLDNFDAWANTYAENVAKFEATESGQLKLTTRFAREWQNMGSLMNLWQTVTDSVTNEDIKATYKAETGQEFPLPQVDGGIRKSVVVKPTAQQEQILQMILAGFAEIEAKNLSKDEAGALRLQLMDLATKNALDPRTINPSLDAGGKIGAVVDNVVDTYHKWSDDKGTQIIFLDRSTPKGKGDDKKIAEYEALLARRENAIQEDNDEELLKVNDLLDKYDENEMAELITAKNGGFTAYDEIKKGLIARGIPADEIAFIQEAESDEDKTALFDQVNAGRVRVIIGSSQRMGAGTNIQKRLVALHHVDAPWKPSDIEQREGRIIRQGNELYEKYGHDNFTVSINAYVTEKTADAKRWDTMSAKLGTINAIRHYNGEHTLDFQEDDDNSSFQEIAALATGNPLMRERVELTAQKEQLDRAKLNHQKRDAGNRTKLTEAQKNAKSLPKQIEAYTKAKAQYDELLPQAQAQFDKTGITIDGKRFTDRKSANDYINNKAKQATDNGKKVSYVINGESVVSLSGATEKIRQSQIAKKGTTPTLITTDGKTSAIVSEAVTDKVINQVNKHNNQTAIAQIMGFNVLSYDTGLNTLLTLETQDGYEIANTTLDHFATREKVENAFGRLVGGLGQNVNNSLQNVQNQLKIANDTIEQLQGKTGLPFDKEQELKDVSDRLNDVQAQLSDDDSENQFKDTAKFADLKALLDSRTLQNGQSATPFVPTADYETSNKASVNKAPPQVDFDELRTIQKDMLSVLDSLPESDPKKDQYVNEVYALDRGDEQLAKDARNQLMKDIATYELVVRKTGELSESLGALGYTVKADKVKQTDDSYTTNMTAAKDDRVLDIRINRMMNEHRANDPTRNGVFVNDNGLNYSFSINEPAISQGIDNYHEYKTNGKHFGDNRPHLTYAKGTTWQEQMRTELARLFDDDPRLAGFVGMANNPELASSYKNEIRLALTHYADRQAEKGNALLPHEVESSIANKRNERQIKADRPYFGKDRPKFDIGEKAKDTKQEIAGQLARLFDDDPKLAEFTDEANKANSPLKLAMILNAIKDHASRMVMDGKALFMGEVLQRQNADYHAGKMKFSRMGAFGERVGLFNLPPIPVTIINAKELGFNDTKKLADEILRQLQGLDSLVNDDTGWVLSVGKKDRKKMGDNKNLSHATSQAVQGIHELVKNAIVAETHQDIKHDNPDVKAVYRLYAPAVIDGQAYRIKLTVKDYQFTTGQDGKKSLHAIEAVEIENALLGTLPSYSTSNDVQTAQPTTGHDISIADLLNGVKHDGDDGLFGVNKKQSKQGGRYGTTAQDVLDVLNNRFGKDIIKKLMNNGSLNIISLAEAKAQFGNIPDDVDGFYTDGTAYLIHDNIHTDMIVPTFLHELGGHGGFETLMSKQAYQSLLNEFHEMVKRGDKTAIQAHALANKHSRTQAEADSEYLAYMITLASRNNSSKAKSLMNRVIMAVKTFLKNTFGISLALTPNDILALSEKMVRNRANGQMGSGIDDVRFSYADSKQIRLEKLKNSKPIEITGREIEPSDDVKEYRKNAYEYGKKLRGTYTNKDTGRTTKVVRESLNEVLRHHAKDEAHLQSIVAIPQIIENAIYIETLPNEDKAKNPLVKEYEYYVVGLKIDGVDYTVKAVLAIDDRDDRYYDHRLTKIEKGNLLASTVRLTNATVAGKLPLDEYDRRLLQILQDKNDESDIQFSRMADMADFYDKNQDKAKEVLGKLGGVVNDFINNPKSFVKSAKQGVGGKAQDHLDKFLQFLGRRQLVDLFAKKLDGLKAYSDRVAQMDADSNENAFRADKLAVKWGKLKDEQALAELMHDVTQKGIDPSRPYQTGDKAQYQRLKRAYDKLSDDAKVVYEQARDDYQDYYKNLHEAMIGRIKRNAKLSNERKQTLLSELDKQYQATQKVFFPLTRFGDYVVVVKDTDGNVVNVARAETKVKADEIRRGLIRDNPNHQVGQVVLGRDLDIRKLGGVQGLASEFLTDELDLGDELHQAYLNSLLDRQFANNNVELKGTAGFSTNARRAYAHHMSRGGYHIARLRHTDRLRAELERMQQHIDENVDNPDYDHVTMQRVVDEMEKRHSLLLNPPSSPVSTMATSLGFMWYLGLSPASALVNISQTFLVALPMMSAKFGSVKSAKMLGEVSKILATNKNDLTEVLMGDEKKAFDEAVRRGAIDMTQAHDLAGIANGEDSRVSQAIQPVMKVASFMFHQAEKYNRQVTYLASYRLGIEKGLSPKQAMEEAIQLTYDGHFDYASSNRPRFMQGNWQRVLFLFKQYSQNMVYTLTRQTYQAVKGETAEQRAEARKILGGILAGHALMAGTLGLPWVITMPFLAMFSALGGDDDDELTDNETEFRNALASVVGEDLAEVIAKGMPRAIGADLSTRVALNDLIIPRTQDGLEGQRQGENVLAAAVGPFFAIPISMLKGMGQIGQGQTMQGVENMIPKALRDPLKAYRYATEGNVDKSGIEIVERENVGISDIAQQAIGFRSGKFAQAQETKSAIYQADKRLSAIRSDLVRQYALAKRNGDDEQMDEIWEEIKRFNAKYPSNKITKPALMRSIHQRQYRIDNAKDGIYLSKNREHLREYGAFGIDE